MRAEWKKAPAFAEVAEALGVQTDQIVGATTDNGITIALWSDPGTDDPQTWGIALVRDGDRILRPFGEPELLPGFWANVHDALDAALGSDDGGAD